MILFLVEHFVPHNHHVSQQFTHLGGVWGTLGSHMSYMSLSLQIMLCSTHTALNVLIHMCFNLPSLLHVASLPSVCVCHCGTSPSVLTFSPEIRRREKVRCTGDAERLCVIECVCVFNKTKRRQDERLRWPTTNQPEISGGRF